MLISKWAAIQAFIDAPFGLVFVVILIFGSALTLFFWAKWMGKLLMISPDTENVEGAVDKNESGGTCVAFRAYGRHLLYLPGNTLQYFIEPFLLANYGSTHQLFFRTTSSSW